MSKPKAICQEKLSGMNNYSPLFGQATCGNNAKHTAADGTPRCGIHSDEAKAARHKRSEARWEARAVASRGRRCREEAQAQVLKLLPDLIAALKAGEPVDPQFVERLEDTYNKAVK